MSAIVQHILRPPDGEVYILHFKDNADKQGIRIHNNGQEMKITDIIMAKVRGKNNYIMVEIIKGKDDQLIIPKAGQKLPAFKPK